MPGRSRRKRRSGSEEVGGGLGLVAVEMGWNGAVGVC